MTSVRKVIRLQKSWISEAFCRLACRRRCRRGRGMTSFRRCCCRFGRRDRRSGRRCSRRLVVLRGRLRSKWEKISSYRVHFGPHTSNRRQGSLRSVISHSVYWYICCVFRLWGVFCLSCHLCRWIWRNVEWTRTFGEMLEVLVCRILCPFEGDIGVFFYLCFCRSSRRILSRSRCSHWCHEWWFG